MHGYVKVMSVIDVLPKQQAELYRSEIPQPPANYQKIYDVLRKEANKIIRQRNETNSRKHKNDPIYSVIIIVYLPANEKLINDKLLEEEYEKNETVKDFDMINMV